MSNGQGNISYNNQGGGAVPPFVNVEGARNGLSLDTDDFVVLGQDVGEAGDPAALISNREIPLVGSFISFLRSIGLSIQISDNGIILFAADTPELVGINEMKIDVLTHQQVDTPSSGGYELGNSNGGGSLLIQITPSGLDPTNAGFMIRCDTSVAVKSLIWYLNGGLGIGGDDFLNNGNETGISVDGAITGQKLVVIKTAPYNLDNRFDAGKVITNTGAAGLTVLQLPQAATVSADAYGYFDFYVDNANGIQLVAAGTDTINIGPSSSSGGGTCTALTAGNTIRLQLLNPGANPAKWVAMFQVGTWVLA
jgi:hypothetical protein